MLLAGVAIVTPAFAWHHRSPPRHGHGGCYHHHHDWYADDFRAGAGIGLASGLIGEAVYNAVRPASPTVVVIDQVQSNGSVTRVWNPGHYETR